MQTNTSQDKEFIRWDLFQSSFTLFFCKQTCPQLCVFFKILLFDWQNFYIGHQRECGGSVTTGPSIDSSSRPEPSKLQPEMILGPCLPTLRATKSKVQNAIIMTPVSRYLMFDDTWEIPCVHSLSSWFSKWNLDKW